ncbi:hypothetical protein [Flavobacterium sp.]|uniref:hypothetical protein n=1 Tax=Flavobacterium sp. TaxID=239 RepID=UPI003D0BFB38
MENSLNIRTIEKISFAYFGTAFLFLINEIFKIHPILNFSGTIRLFILVILYLYSSSKKNSIYLGVLVFVIISNYLFQLKDQKFLAYGMVAYLFNRLFTVVLVYKSIKGIKAFPVIIASIPFLFFYLYMIFLAEELFSLGFFSLFLNSLFMSFLGGISLSNYYLDHNDYNNKNALLLVSIILFVMQNLIFLLQKYYQFDGLFEPVSIILNTAALYVFYKFVLLSEQN